MTEKERYYSLSLLKSLAYDDDVNGNRDGMIDFTVIDSIGGADVEKVRHGEWISARPSGGYDFYCSCCKEFAITYEDSNYREQYYLTDYCPNCGSKMDGGNK